MLGNVNVEYNANANASGSNSFSVASVLLACVCPRIGFCCPSTYDVFVPDHHIHNAWFSSANEIALNLDIMQVFLHHQCALLTNERLHDILINAFHGAAFKLGSGAMLTPTPGKAN